MVEQILVAMAKENAFFFSLIEWMPLFEEKEIPPYWHVYFISRNDPIIRYPLDKARGGQRRFKTIDAAYAAITKIADGRVRDVRIIPEPW